MQTPLLSHLPLADLSQTDQLRPVQRGYSMIKIIFEIMHCCIYTNIQKLVVCTFFYAFFKGMLTKAELK